jgi:hypothetical protein
MNAEHVNKMMRESLRREQEKDAEIQRLKGWLLKASEVIESEGLSVELCTDDEELGEWLKKERT